MLTFRWFPADVIVFHKDLPVEKSTNVLVGQKTKSVLMLIAKMPHRMHSLLMKGK